MALNDYTENQYLPEPLRVWLNTPNRVSSFKSYDFLRMFDGFDLMAVLNNRYASEIASGYTNANVSNLMSGVAPRLQQILVSKIINKVDYIGFEECQKLSTMLDKQYLSIKLKKSFNNAIRTGRDLAVLYPKEVKDDLGNVIKREIHIQNIDCFRHILKFDDEKINDVLILLNQIPLKGNSFYNVFEHRYYNKDGKPFAEFILSKMEWDNDRYETTRKRFYTKEEFKTTFEGLTDATIMEQLKAYKFYNPAELPFEDLGCYHIDNTEYNSKYPMTTIPESRFVNVQDKIMEIETSITYKEVDKNIGRGRAVIPSSFDFTKGLTAIGSVGGDSSNLQNRSVFSNPLDSTYFIQYNTNATDKAIAPQGIQFDIRSDAWRTSLNGEIGDLCAAFGISVLDYDPRLLQTGQRTDDEINAMTDITANTVEALRSMNEYQINLMLNTIAKYAGEEVKVAVKWNLSAIINPIKNEELITRKLENGTISRKEAIKRSNPDYTDAEVEEQLKVIQDERGLEEANAVF